MDILSRHAIQFECYTKEIRFRASARDCIHQLHFARTFFFLIQFLHWFGRPVGLYFFFSFFLSFFLPSLHTLLRMIYFCHMHIVQIVCMFTENNINAIRSTTRPNFSLISHVYSLHCPFAMRRQYPTVHRMFSASFSPFYQQWINASKFHTYTHTS